MLWAMVVSGWVETRVESLKEIQGACQVHRASLWIRWGYSWPFMEGNKFWSLCSWQNYSACQVHVKNSWRKFCFDTLIRAAISNQLNIHWGGRTQSSSSSPLGGGDPLVLRCVISQRCAVSTLPEQGSCVGFHRLFGVLLQWARIPLPSI